MQYGRSAPRHIHSGVQRVKAEEKVAIIEIGLIYIPLTLILLKYFTHALSNVEGLQYKKKCISCFHDGPA